MCKWITVLVALGISCFAAPEHVEWRAAQIQTVLQQADEAYYDRGDPIMTDEAYDALHEQYEQLRVDYPDLPVLSSVGADVPDMDTPVPHTRPMLSLKKAYSDEAVVDFLNECGTNETYCVEPKIDGVSVIFRYRDGQLVQALTRGDGHVGKDVTAQIMAAGCVPVLLTNAPVVLEVRGEVFMPFEAFNAMNVRRMEKGNEPLKSPRNSAAGTLRMKDLAEVAKRGLASRIFAVIDADPMPSSHIHGLALLSDCGLPAMPCRAVPGSKVLETIGELNGQRSGLPYPTDGVVVRLDERAIYERMGSTARWPNGALARKYKPVPVDSRLLAVEWTQGENGRLTPVACFEPVEVDGATLQRASLGSLEHLRALDLMIGDRIQVIRAGGSIPVILGRCSGLRTGEEPPIPYPVNPVQ